MLRALKDALFLKKYLEAGDVVIIGPNRNLGVVVSSAFVRKDWKNVPGHRVFLVLAENGEVISFFASRKPWTMFGLGYEVRLL